MMDRGCGFARQKLGPMQRVRPTSASLKETVAAGPRWEERGAAHKRTRAAGILATTHHFAHTDDPLASAVVLMGHALQLGVPVLGAKWPIGHGPQNPGFVGSDSSPLGQASHSFVLPVLLSLRSQAHRGRESKMTGRLVQASPLLSCKWDATSREQWYYAQIKEQTWVGIRCRACTRCTAFVL